MATEGNESAGGASKAGGEMSFDPSNEDAIYILRWVDNEDGVRMESFGYLREGEVDGRTGVVFEEEPAYSYPFEHARWNELTPAGYRSGEGEDQVWVGEVKGGAFKEEENIISIEGPLTAAQIRARLDNIAMPPPPARTIVRVRRRSGAQKGTLLDRPRARLVTHPSFVFTAGEKGVGGRDVSTDELESMTRGLQKLTLKRHRRGGRSRRRKKRKRRTRRKGRRRRTRRRRKRRRL